MLRKPTYQHDCDNCRFMAHADGKDWYVCAPVAHGRGSVIGRFGNDGPEFWSMSADMVRSNDLRSFDVKSGKASVMIETGIAKSILIAFEYQCAMDQYAGKES